jgi:N-acetylglutamate synthase-like GNAT family acetyltransferase
MTTSCVRLRPAGPADRPTVEALLAEAGLPLQGVAEWVDRFWLAEPADGSGTAPVGVAGLELHGDAALLRSVAVAPEWRGSGVARLLTERVLDEAKAAGARETYLLTTTAEGYFTRLGFSCLARDEAPAALQASAEFRGACPASATLMRHPLGDASP